MSFLKLSSARITIRTAEASYAKEFGLIPNGTQAYAQIKDFLLMDPTEYYINQFYQLSLKLTTGDYSGREVRLNIYPYDDKPQASDRGINLLKRIYDLAAINHCIAIHQLLKT